MERTLIRTEDGSATLYVPELNEHYHSVHGAVQESLHIFIRAGVEESGKEELRILEAGFGTGLNAYLTLLHAHRNRLSVAYHTLEKYPLSPEEYHLLNYTEHSAEPEDLAGIFRQLHESPWETDLRLTPGFLLHKYRTDFREIGFSEQFDIVFFDAFSPEVQPALWSEAVFQKYLRALVPGGILVTYCVKGTVKQALRKVGFTVKRLPGPPGKREMLRAVKPV
ncbi:MAG: tRNA (5-methylaminomethyl-2-thiouridine)(34)-methyltransferase MnmD [Culturomica sp.]|jgi:tRNA U34 5-methylaminomethyl-2-thiouridine-forming methyltransferase MnmC|nr:tRNA (5-methylaminomethyl-2-thiouridine)(34)-methyltransferase MnmD [Culturomica sp.]